MGTIPGPVSVPQSPANCPAGMVHATRGPIGVGRVAALVSAFEETNGGGDMKVNSENRISQGTARELCKNSSNDTEIAWGSAQEISDVAWIDRTEDLSVLIQNASERAVLTIDGAEHPAVNREIYAEEGVLPAADQTFPDVAMDCPVEWNTLSSEDEVFPPVVKKVHWDSGHPHGDFDVSEIEIEPMPPTTPPAPEEDEAAGDGMRTKPKSRTGVRYTCGLPRGRSLRHAMASLKRTLSRSLSSNRTRK